MTDVTLFRENGPNVADEIDGLRPEGWGSQGQGGYPDQVGSHAVPVSAILAHNAMINLLVFAQYFVSAVMY